MKNPGIFYDHLVYFTAIGNILWPFGIFFPNLVFCTLKNLATQFRPIWQGCQIFWYNILKRGKNIPNDYTKLPNAHKIYPVVVKYSK
jgi:hypothetical protein